MHRIRLVFLLFASACLPVATAAPSASARDRWSDRRQVVDLPAVHPPLRLTIARDFEPAATLAFPIGQLTHVQRRVFVDAGRDRRVRRLVIVQYETAQSGSSFRFVFPSTPPRQFGAATYRFGAFVYDDEAAAAAAPDRESAHTRARLRELGYRVPRFERMLRLARVADPAGTSEVIVFYLENADADYPQGLTGADADGVVVLGAQAGAALYQRMRAVVRVDSG